MDDLESLVFLLWYVAGVQWDKPSLLSLRRPEGVTLAECKIKATARAKMTVIINAKLTRNESELRTLFLFHPFSMQYIRKK